MDGRRRGDLAVPGAVGWLVLLLLASLCAGSRGLNADGWLLMAFRNAVTADPLGALAGWSYSDATPCAWNGVICNVFPQPDTVTSASADGNGNGNSAPVLTPDAAGGLGASLAAATVSRVISLVLPNAQLSGTLPPELGRVDHLRHLDLSGNSLSGGLPPTLLNATDLHVLSLAGNAISGELPDATAAYARGLQALNLSGNTLAGRLPAALCRLPSLVVLGLAGNRLSGELPIGGLGTLEIVDLSGNGFNGALPSDFGGPRLRLLNISSNKIAGAVPTQLAALVPANATVDLSRNNFTGAIPPSLSNPPNATDSPPAFALSSPPPSPTANGTSSITSSLKSKKRGIFGFILGLCGFIFVAYLVVIFFTWRRLRLQRRQEMQEEIEEAELGRLPGMPRRFTFEQLQEATDQFREKLGEGGFGSVFKGRFGEQSIAVKRLDRAGQGKREFLAEVQTIGSIHHINLVSIIGFCAEKSHRLLVYEYMPKGSLDQWIFHQHGNSDTPCLDWQTRCKIIVHIAKGLAYLHEECMKKVAHLDIKPQNILLDDNFNAKLSDFGLCKLIDRDTSQVVTRMRGTPGYLAPEWLTSHITEKADIYSFGVVVMEIISGRKNLDTSRSQNSFHLITLLEEKLKSDHLVDLIDMCSSSDSQAHKQEAIQMMKLAMWCLQIDCKRRPKMSDVVKVLEGTMSAETDLDHNFVVTNLATLASSGIVDLSTRPLASVVSGPR